MNNTNLNIESLSLDNEIISTIRLKTVIEKIKLFVSKNNLDPRLVNSILRNIIREQSFGLNIDPSYLLFNEQEVIRHLNSLNIKNLI